MSGELGNLVLSMSADVAKFESDLGRANQVAQRNARNMEQSFEGLKDVISGLSVAEFIREMISAAKEAEQADSRLTAVLKATGDAAGLTRRELDELADSTAAYSQFSDEGARNAESTLLKFGNVQEDVFRRALALSADYAAFMGTDLPSAAQVLGKALSSPNEAVGQLERQVGKLTLAQRDLIDGFVKSNDLAGAQGAILDILQSKIGGAAKEMNTGYTRAVGDAHKAWDEFLEALGRSPAISATAQTALAGVEMTLNGLRAGVGVISGIFNSLNYTSTYRPPETAQDRAAAQATAKAAADNARQQALADKQLAEQRRADAELRRQHEADAQKAELERQRAHQKALADIESGNAKSIAAVYDEEEERRLENGKLMLAERHAREAEEAAMQQSADRYRDLLDPMRAYTRQLDEIVKLENAHFLDNGEAAAAYDKILMQQMEDSQRRFGDFKENGKAATDELVRAFEGWGRSVSKDLADMEVNSDFTFGKIRDSARNLLRDIVAMSIDRAITQKVVTAGAGLLDKAIGGLGSKLGDYFGGGGNDYALADSQMAMIGGSQAGHANGLDYVPQTGIYKLHQGEKVTPAAANNGTGNATVFNIDARGADSAGLARLENMIKQIGGSIKPMAAAAVREMAVRDPGFTKAMRGGA